MATVYCQANEDCDAEEFVCGCGVVCCSVHGHVDEGDGQDSASGPNLVDEDAPARARIIKRPKYEDHYEECPECSYRAGHDGPHRWQR